MSDRLSLFSKEIILFIATIAIGLFAAHRHALSGLPSFLEPVDVTSSDILIFIAVFLIFTTLLVKFARAGDYALRVAMAIAVFVGVQFVAAAFLPDPWPLLAGLAFAVAPILSRTLYIRVANVMSRFLPVLLVHNTAMVVSIAGISAIVGLSITPTMATILLVVLSFYDIFAVYHTKHMVKIAERMMSAGAIFGFLVPARWKDLVSLSSDGQIMPRVMVLGSGDIGLPLVLAASIVPFSVPAAIIVSAFSVAGLGVTHWLFTAQRKSAAMAALPPIAAAAIIGYLVAILLGV